MLLSLPSLWFYGFLVFVYSIPHIPTDTSTPTDAIVVWTGGPCRITTGVELLAQGLSNKLFVSGVETSKPTLLGLQCGSYLSRQALEPLQDKIYLGHSALSTLGNAIETSAWVRKNQIRSVRLVTTPVHMPRSLSEFQAEMPHIDVIPHPVNIINFDHRRWYQSWSVFFKVSREYCKFLLVKVGIRPWWRENILENP